MLKENFDNRPKALKKKLNVLPQNPETASQEKAVGLGRFPSWLHRKLPKGRGLLETGLALEGERLHTVCEEAKCPNLLECWSRKSATFLVMGKVCTRACGFCEIGFSKAPPPLDPDEPKNVAEAAKKLGLKHIVITMVARDDLEDQGANHLIQILKEIKRVLPNCTLEILTSDFNGNKDCLNKLLKEPIDIFNHNIETVRSLTPRVRHVATYERTLEVLAHMASNRTSLKPYVKSGLMVGLGESRNEVFETIRDLKEAGSDIITIGHYLQASSRKLTVKAFISPEEFELYNEFGKSIGVKAMYTGPFVRSSYNAESILENL